MKTKHLPIRKSKVYTHNGIQWVIFLKWRKYPYTITRDVIELEYNI